MPDTFAFALAIGGIGAGLWLLAQGIGGYRAAVRIGDTATSRIATLAAGEVRITGVVEPAEVTLVSPLQSAVSVWYRSRVQARDGETSGGQFEEERAVGFRVRDETGSVRVFPRDARFDVPDVYNERTGAFGEAPVGLNLRDGPAYAAAKDLDREAAVARLLTVRGGDDRRFAQSTDDLGLRRGGSRRYTEARLEPGDVVTVIGTAVPFGHLPDPAGHDLLDRFGDPGVGLDDPEVAASIAGARAAGTLLTPEQAWGNAAIPGFGIGKPVRAPELDPDATPPDLATPEEAEAAERVFDLEPDLLVLAAEPESPLVIAAGTPAQAVGRGEARFLVGLLGAVLAIVSAVALALLASGAAG